eukprot:322942-Chlamydomonas_euryale.AAC.1
MPSMQPMELDAENPTPQQQRCAGLGGGGGAGEGAPALLLVAGAADEDAYLADLAGVERLCDATSLRAQVNTGLVTVAHVGPKLPSLTELNLTGSVLESVRDLGTGFRLLQVLWVAQCGLRDLDGLSGMPSLRELYASYNDIADVHALDACGELEVLDVEGNCMVEPGSLAVLAGACPRLQSLSIGGNPMLDAPGFHQQLAALRSALPSLEEVDMGGSGSGGGAGGAHAHADTRVEGAHAAAHHQGAEDEHAAPRHADAQSGTHAHGKSATACDGAGAHDAEMDLVRQGIKHARVGVDSVEFRELEMTLLVVGDALAPEALGGGATLL